MDRCTYRAYRKLVNFLELYEAAKPILTEMREVDKSEPYAGVELTVLQGLGSILKVVDAEKARISVTVKDVNAGKLGRVPKQRDHAAASEKRTATLAAKHEKATAIKSKAVGKPAKAPKAKAIDPAELGI